MLSNHSAITLKDHVHSHCIAPQLKYDNDLIYKSRAVKYIKLVFSSI